MEDEKKTLKKFQPDHILSYFRMEWKVLAAVTISGLIYNLGLLAGPWFEGKMAGCLVDILKNLAGFPDMLLLAGGYMLVIAIVQIARYLKRLYVRKFANQVNRLMKQILYHTLVHQSRRGLHQEAAGSVMTKAILDVDDCVEGMRKFTTEIFDTGVAMAAYTGMLLYYDWRLAFLGIMFTPVSYLLAEKLKRIVQRTGAQYKVQAGRLSSATLDRASNAVTYRVYGRERERQNAYEQHLTEYEKSAVKANIWSSVMQPLYRAISLAGVLFILYFGGRNVLGTGWAVWDIATFTTFLSCFTKLAVKSSSAAKLFNAVHKAQVSWKRIKPLMQQAVKREEVCIQKPAELEVSKLGFSYPDGTRVYEDISFSAKPGQIIGVTGAVACGKSTFGKTFLCEYPYEGNVRFGGRELCEMSRSELAGSVGYLGHDPELFADSVKNNILLGDQRKDAGEYLKAVCLNEEVNAMTQGADTIVGNSGVRLSGGQAQRLALARTLCHTRPLLILDDPFSALDRNTERQVFQHLKELCTDNIVILISHRLYLFPELDQIIWMENGHGRIATHEELMESEPGYVKLYQMGDDSASQQEGRGVFEREQEGGTAI